MQYQKDVSPAEQLNGPIDQVKSEETGPSADQASSISDEGARDMVPEKIPPTREIDFIDLGDGTLVDVIEDPAHPTRTKFAIFKEGHVRYADRLEHHGEILVPMPQTGFAFSHVRLPRGVMSFASVEELFVDIVAFISCQVDVPRHYLLVLAAFVLYDWVADRLSPAVYLAIVGLPQSGKTTLLECLNSICRRPLLVSDVSEAAINIACSQFSPTVLIDEIEWNSPSGRRLRRQLRAGTGTSSRVLRVHHSASSFGPKVLSSLKPSPDAALNSRCFQIIMTETKRQSRQKPTDHRLIPNVDKLQQQLLKFRFDSYFSIRPAIILGAEKLRPRSQDLLACLAAPVAKCRNWPEGFFRTAGADKVLLAVIQTYHDPVTREFLDPHQDAILAIVFKFIHQFPDLSGVHVKDVARETNALLAAYGERGIITDRAVGGILSSLGFTGKHRTNSGWVLRLDSTTKDRAHQLLATHGIAHLQDGELKRDAKDCQACRDFLAPSRSPAASD